MPDPFRRLLSGLAGGTVVLSSHVMGEVERVCDRIGIIRDGQLVTVQDVGGGLRGHVVGGEQHLADGESMRAEGCLVGRHEGSLSHAGCRLLGREVARPGGQRERLKAGGDGS